LLLSLPHYLLDSLLIASLVLPYVMVDYLRSCFHSHANLGDEASQEEKYLISAGYQKEPMASFYTASFYDILYEAHSRVTLGYFHTSSS